MPTLTTKEQIAALTKKFNDEVAAIQKTAIKGLLTPLADAKTAFDALDKETRAVALADAEVKKILASFGVKSSGGKGGTRSGGKYDEAKIIEFLGSEGKFQDEVQKEFKVSKQGANDWKPKLEGKVNFTKVKPVNGKRKKMFWAKIP